MNDNSSRSLLYDRKDDDFFNKEDCDRCGGSLRTNSVKTFTMSWFTEETICTVCDEKEIDLKEQMRKVGINPDEYEGCGYIPVVKIESSINIERSEVNGEDNAI